MKKRLLSVFLALCMVLTLTPAVFAAEGDTFTDVNSSDWYYSDVQYVSEHNLMNGVGGENFAPDQTTTRGMIVTIFYRLEGSPATGSNPFSKRLPDTFRRDLCKLMSKFVF